MISKILRIYRRTFWSCEKYARYMGVIIGKNCLVSTKNFSSEGYLISIGDYCRIAKNVSFYTHGGVWSQRQKLKENLDYFGKIKIGNYTYIGEDSKILPGVTIGNDVIVGAGTVVTKSIPDGVVFAGNPGKIVGDTESFVAKVRMFDLKTKKMNSLEKKEFLLNLADNKFIRK